MVAVNVDNFREAETALMFDNQLAMTGGVNKWFQSRTPSEGRPLSTSPGIHQPPSSSADPRENRQIPMS